MARISTYQVDTNVTGADIWIGTDGNDNKKTKNFSPNILAQYLNENEVISTANSLRYRYDTIASGDSRKTGTISFQTEIGANVAFSSITTFILSNKTLGSNTVDAFLNILPNTRILIQNSSNINFFGIYFVDSITPHLTETGYYIVNLTYVSGNGNLSEDMDYLIHLIEYKSIVPTNTSDLVNDGEDGVHPFITAQDITIPTLQSVTDEGNTTTNSITVDSPNYYSIVEPSDLGTENKNTGAYAYLGGDGVLGLNNGNVESDLKNTNVTNGGVVLEFPNKTSGSYTIATTEDIIVPTLQSVTDEGNTTTNPITVYSLDYQTVLNSEYVNVSDLNTNSFAVINRSGELQLSSDGLNASVLRNTNVAASGVILEFPDKIPGSYTIATTNDITIPNLQEVTDQDSTTTNTITIDSTQYQSAIANNNIYTTDKTTGSGVGLDPLGLVNFDNGTGGSGIISSQPLTHSNVVLDFPDKTSGNYTIATTDDIDTHGLPPGGTAGQILTKVDANDYNATWQENYADWTSVVKHIVKNDGTGLITKGTPVYTTGSNGTNILVGKAGYGSEATSSKTMGLMQSDITTTGVNSTGYVITEGLLGGLNTAGQTAGDPVWLGPTGTLIYGLTNKPYAPNHLVFIGIVTKVSAGNGEIFVKCQNGFELQEIHNIDLVTTTPINGHLLGYNGTLWVNKTIAGWLGYTPANKAGDTFTGNIDAPSMSIGGTDLESLMIAYAVALG